MNFNDKKHTFNVLMSFFSNFFQIPSQALSWNQNPKIIHADISARFHLQTIRILTERVQAALCVCAVCFFFLYLYDLKVNLKSGFNMDGAFLGLFHLPLVMVMHYRVNSFCCSPRNEDQTIWNPVEYISFQIGFK